jgi:hypothetical protein
MLSADPPVNGEGGQGHTPVAQGKHSGIRSALAFKTKLTRSGPPARFAPHWRQHQWFVH